MITIEGLCGQLRRYNESNKRTDTIRLHGDTHCDLVDETTGGCIGFGNPYQLMEYLTYHTGVQK